MARIRTIKPELFRHKGLFDLEQKTGLPLRIAWAGLLTVADREGRFKWQPEVIQLDVLPFDREVPMDLVLEELWKAGFIHRYCVGDREYGRIPSFLDHQVINHREAKSKIPSPDDGQLLAPSVHLPETPGHARGELEGKGRELEKEKELELEGKEDSSAMDEASTRGELPAQVTPVTGRGPVLGAIPEFVDDPVCSHWLEGVSEAVQRAWILAYPSPEWVIQEIKNANVWLISNPKKNPKKFGAFMSNWLSRSFEKYRKGLPTNFQTHSQKNADALRDMHERVLKGEL